MLFYREKKIDCGEYREVDVIPRTDNAESGKAIISDGVTVNQAVKKLYEYENTGLSPLEVKNLIEREKNLSAKVLKMQDW